MRNQSPDKYNVAWFKLAECVSRGEKERALGVYKLLAHSLHDQAFARQLQGDILCAFNDTHAAVEHYCSAAHMYRQDNRLLEAAAVYEHVITLVSDKQKYLTTLLDLYSSLGMQSKIIMHVSTYVALLLAQELLDEALACIDMYTSSIVSLEAPQIRQQLISAWLQKEKNIERITDSIKIVLDAFIKVDNTLELQKFLTVLQALNTECYEYACDYVKHVDH